MYACLMHAMYANDMPIIGLTKMNMLYTTYAKHRVPCSK